MASLLNTEDQIDSNQKITVTLHNLETELLSLQVIENYSSDTTPFDNFDTECHQEDNNNVWGGSKEEDITFMINVAEHCQRPQDMLMFLGEYFKALIANTEKINNDIKDKKTSGR